MTNFAGRRGARAIKFVQTKRLNSHDQPMQMTGNSFISSGSEMQWSAISKNRWNTKVQVTFYSVTMPLNWSLTLQNRELVVSTENTVSKFPVSRCSSHVELDSCIEIQDPHCCWCQTSHSCSHVSEWWVLLIFGIDFSEPYRISTYFITWRFRK